MKTMVAMTAALALLVSAGAQTPAPKTSPAASQLPAVKKDATKKEKAPSTSKTNEAAPKIEGLEVGRGEKGFLGVQIVDSKFKITFYDAKKKPVAPDVTRAALRWDAKHKTGPERAILMPGGGPNSLASDKHVKPPYNFKLFIVLLKDGADEAAPGETLVVDFRQ